MTVQVAVTKVFEFEAAHWLEDYDGKCASLHGHTYRLEVTVKGPRDGRGIVVDFKDLKQVVEEAFLEPFLDHRCLNDTVPVNTTAENLVVWFFDYWHREVTPRWPGVCLERVVIWETPTSAATLTRADWEAGGGGAEKAGGGLAHQ